MKKLMKYRVVREHQGERDFAVGDERVADPGAVAHLVPNVLELIGPADAEEAEPGAKAEPSPENKAEPAAPANKAARAPRPRQRKNPGK